MKATTIQEVVDSLEKIIDDAEKENDPLGYFAALYQLVTKTVRDKIGTGYFEDDKRMEKLDVTFANRYLEAHADFTKDKIITKSWKKAFDLSRKKKIIVLQHLLLGMNAHINLDLGIAAAEISTPENIEDLQKDFNKINEVLSVLTKNVEKDLSEIWPTLKWILKLTRKVDDFLIGFSMEFARDEAWRLANQLVGKEGAEKEQLIKERDQDVATLTRLIVPQNFIERFIFWIIRIGEKGDVAFKIKTLRD